MKRILIIQTAFIGDVILATSVAEKLHQKYPVAEIDFLVRKGNETLFANHPFLKNVIAWDKKKNKMRNLFSILRYIRGERYDIAITIHRWSSSGLLVGLSKANERIGFKQNPLSFLFTRKINHEIGNGKHEVERNQQLIAHITDYQYAMPKLYPSEANKAAIQKYKTGNYICIAPTSVWFTKQFPMEKWVELINTLKDVTVYLLGASNDSAFCEQIKCVVKNPTIPLINLCGRLTFLESATLMRDAKMNYVNDSGPMHIASAVNAPTTAIFCSTVPAFGFGPLSSNSSIVETKEKLDCRPCGLHGHRVCPKGHYRCANSIKISDFIN